MPGATGFCRAVGGASTAAANDTARCWGIFGTADFRIAPKRKGHSLRGISGQAMAG